MPWASTTASRAPSARRAWCAALCRFATPASAAQLRPQQLDHLVAREPVARREREQLDEVRPAPLLERPGADRRAVDRPPRSPRASGCRHACGDPAMRRNGVARLGRFWEARPGRVLADSVNHPGGPARPTRREPRMTQVQDRIRNGVDTEQMFGTLDLLKQQPELATFTFRAAQPLARRRAQPLHDPGLLRRGRRGHLARRGVRPRRRRAGDPPRHATPARTRRSPCCTRSPRA